MARITKQPRIITITLHSTKNKLLFLLPISNSLSSTSLSSISYNIPLSFNYVLAIFWLQHIERRLRFFVQQSITLYKIKCNKAKQNRILQALPLKCAVRIFRTSTTCRTSEGGKSEFLGGRRARDLDTLPQKERKPRLKKTILRRNRVPPQRAIVRPVR